MTYYRYLSKVEPLALKHYMKMQLIHSFIEEHKEINKFECEFNVIPLEDWELEMMVDRHKKDNGTYFYQGVQYTFEGIREKVQEEFVKFELIVEESKDEQV